MNTIERPVHAEYVDTWLAREPEMRLAELFVPPALRARHRLWGALLHELREALFELSDPAVTAAKVGWWGEELLATAAGRARHPLTVALPAAAPWPGLAAMLARRLEDAEPRPERVDQALLDLRPLAAATVAVEGALFGFGSDDAAVEALAAYLLLERLGSGLARGEAEVLPLALLARHGVTAAELARRPGHPALREWARSLRERLPASLREAALLRHQRLALDRVRLRRLEGGRGLARPTGPGVLLPVWRASRRGLACMSHATP